MKKRHASTALFFRSRLKLALIKWLQLEELKAEANRVSAPTHLAPISAFMSSENINRKPYDGFPKKHIKETQI